MRIWFWSFRIDQALHAAHDIPGSRREILGTDSPCKDELFARNYCKQNSPVELELLTTMQKVELLQLCEDMTLILNLNQVLRSGPRMSARVH